MDVGSVAVLIADGCTKEVERLIDDVVVASGKERSDTDEKGEGG